MKSLAERLKYFLKTLLDIFSNLLWWKKRSESSIGARFKSTRRKNRNKGKWPFQNVI